MTHRTFIAAARVGCIALALMFTSTVAANAATIYWTNWTGADTDPGVGFTGLGTITTPTTTVNVTYTNAQGIAFYQSSGGTDYWTPRTPVASSPYTSTLVDNPPPDPDIIALLHAGNQTLTFSQPIANPDFAFVSLNGNGYAFLNQDFTILSLGGVDGNQCGFWGCGGATKNIVNLGGGNFEYQLIANNVGGSEPHGTIQFTGSFATLTWRSLTDENWNGFTVGVQGTSQEVFPPDGNAVPEPATLLLLGTGLAGAASRRRNRKA